MARLRTILLVAVFAVFGIGQATAQDTPGVDGDAFETSGLLVYNLWVRPTAGLLAESETPEAPISGTVTGAFMTIENMSANDYQLVGVASAVAEMSHLHETTTSGNMSGMRMINAVDVPAGETVKLESGGYHAMLMNMIADIRSGDAVPLTLTFADVNGARFSVVTAGLATDFPPEASSIIAANAVGTLNADGTVDVSLILDNRGGQGDTLVGVASVPNATSGIVDGEAVLASLEVPAGRQAVMIHLSDFEAPPDKMMTLTLTFAAGGELTLAAPVLEGGA